MLQAYEITVAARVAEGVADLLLNGEIATTDALDWTGIARSRGVADAEEFRARVEAYAKERARKAVA